MRQRYKEGSDLIKITASGGVLSVAKSGENPQFTEEELKAIVETAKDYGFKVAAHCHGAGRVERRAMKSCLYIGQIRHRRFAPKRNDFRYRIFLTLVDLSELPSLFDRFWLWSARHPALAWFRRADYHGLRTPLPDRHFDGQ